LSVPVQVIAWMTISEMTCNVLSGMFKPYLLTHYLPPDTGKRAPP